MSMINNIIPVSIALVWWDERDKQIENSGFVKTFDEHLT